MNKLLEAENIIAGVQIREAQRLEAHSEKVRSLELKTKEAELRGALARELFSKNLVARELKLSVAEVDRMVQAKLIGEN